MAPREGRIARELAALGFKLIATSGTRLLQILLLTITVAVALTSKEPSTGVVLVPTVCITFTSGSTLAYA